MKHCPVPRSSAFQACLPLNLVPLRIAVLAALTVPAAMAQDTWDGGGLDDDFSTDLNWVDNTAPVGGQITFSGVTRTTPNNDLVGATFGAILLGNNGTAATNDQAFTLSGNSITLGGNISATPIVSGGTALEDTIDLDLVLNTNRTLLPDSANGGHNIRISGNISGAFTLIAGGTNDTGLSILSGNNTHNQTSVGRNGQLRIESDTALGNRGLIGRNSDLFIADGLTINPVNGIAFQNSANSHVLQLNNTGSTSAEIQSKVDVQINGTANSRSASINTGADDTLTISGQLTSDNSNTAKRLFKQGAGTLILTNGTNDYEGVLRVDSGNLELQHSLALQDAVVGPNGGTVVFDHATTAGVATFGALNFTQGLVLQTSTGEALALTLDNNFTDVRDYPGVLSDNGAGGGSLIKQGTYTQILRGINTYGGTTTISGGTLQLGNASTTGSLVATTGITNNANLTISRTNVFAQAIDLNGQVITGTGSLMQAGTGTTTLSEANTYTGITTVSAGTLDVTGSLTSDVTVADGATLSGGGSTTGSLTLGDGTSTGATLLVNDGSGFTSNGLTTNITGETVTVNLTGSSTGTVDILTYGPGTFTGDETTDFTVNNLGGHGGAGAITDSGTAISVATGRADNTWIGTTDGTWEIGGSNSNWQNATADGLFYDNDSITFDNTGIAQSTVTLASSLAPDSITFAHTSGTYTINDSGGGETITLATGISNTADGDTTINAILSGPGGISNTGTGTLTLGGPNTFAGDIVNDGAIVFNQTGAADYANDISGSGSLAFSGTGTTTLNGSNSYSGGTTLNSGRLNVAVSGVLGTGTVTLNGGLIYESGGTVILGNPIHITGTTAIQANGGGNFTLNGVITGAGTLNAGGVAPASSVIISDDLSGFTGTMTHANVNGDNNFTFTGPSPVNTTASFSTSGTTAGTRTLTFSSGATIGELSGTGGRIRSNGPLVVNQSTTTTYAGKLENRGGDAMIFEKQGAGTLTLTFNNTHSGGTTITAGRLEVGNGGTTGTLGGGAVVNNAELAYNRSNNYTIGNSLSGTGSVELTAGGATDSVISGTNTYEGGTTIFGGVFRVTSDGNLGATSSTLTLDGGALKNNAGLLALDAARSVVIGASGGQIEAGWETTLTINGIVSGSGDLTINSDSGTPVLAGVNTHTGDLIVNSHPSLLPDLSVTGSLGSGSYAGTISGDGDIDFDLSGTQILSGVNTYTGNTTVSAGTLTLASGGQATFVPTTDGVNNQINGAGTLNLEGGIYLDLSGADAAGIHSWLLIDVTNLTETYAGTFSVNSSLGVFTDDGGTWTLDDGTNVWTFEQTTGTLSVTSPYFAWADSFGLTGDDALETANPDSDALNNLQEYAFGTDPSMSTGSVSVTGGVATPGAPAVWVDPADNKVYLRYSRRADYASIVLGYIEEFSPDDLIFEDGNDVPDGSLTPVGTGTGPGSIAVEAVQVEFPGILSVSGRKARFGRLDVTHTP